MIGGNSAKILTGAKRAAQINFDKLDDADIRFKD
jgi:hypothetical protein